MVRRLIENLGIRRLLSGQVEQNVGDRIENIEVIEADTRQDEEVEY
jgi:hypothetical protein